MKPAYLLIIPLVLTGCATSNEFQEPATPAQWEGSGQHASAHNLARWWTSFNDATLNTLIEQARANSPRTHIAQARIEEARGLRRSARSSLFPEIGARGQLGVTREGIRRENDTFYEAGLDASWEIDLFGKNRARADAADARLEALKAEINYVELTLIAEVARTYIEYRAAQKQSAIARDNLQTQQKTLELIQHQRELGESTQLDVERSENLVHTTKASIPEFDRLASNARLRLAVLTGQLPEQLPREALAHGPIPETTILPLLMEPAEVLSNRPDLRVARAELAANTALSEAAIADLYPSINLAGFYGIAEGPLFDPTAIWSGIIGGAINLIDFGRLEGQVDAAQARQVQAYESYRLSLLSAVAEVEGALMDHARVREQRVALNAAYENAHRAFKLSQDLFREGEISFLDILDAQRTLNDTEASLVTAEAAQARSLIRHYETLGVY